MQLFSFGLNHTTAPVDIRERVNFAGDDLKQALQQLIARELVSEVVIISTCNRTELYAVMESDTQELLISWLCDYHNIALTQLKPYLYIHTQAEHIIRHLYRVACGLDSMILGEPQILGQLKTAYQTARAQATVGRLLSRLFEQSFSVAKQVRTDTAIGSSPVSVAFAAVRLAQQIFGDLRPITALLIGAGETVELAARHLHENQLGRMIVANRTVERARTLAKEFSGYAITLEEIPMHLAEADVVIASTGSPSYILTKSAVINAIKTRRHRPMFMVDIAVPRDIEPSIGELEDVYLYSVDDLNEVIQENLRSRAQAAHQAEEILDTQLIHFMGWLSSLNAVDTICDLREQAHQASHNLVERAKRMLDNGRPPYEVIDFLAHTLTNTLMHAPCAQLRQASYEGQHDLVEIARRLFQLEEKQT